LNCKYCFLVAHHLSLFKLVKKQIGSLIYQPPPEKQTGKNLRDLQKCLWFF